MWMVQRVVEGELRRTRWKGKRRQGKAHLPIFVAPQLPFLPESVSVLEVSPDQTEDNQLTAITERKVQTLSMSAATSTSEEDEASTLEAPTFCQPSCGGGATGGRPAALRPSASAFS